MPNPMYPINLFGPKRLNYPANYQAFRPGEFSLPISRPIIIQNNNYNNPLYNNPNFWDMRDPWDKTMDKISDGLFAAGTFTGILKEALGIFGIGNNNQV